MSSFNPYFMVTGQDFVNLIQIPTGNITTISDLITRIISLLLYFIAILAFFYLIYSGILYITAAGNPDQAKKAQQGLIYAIIGIIIVVLSYTILRVVANLAERL